MREALDLARKGRAQASPNPMVGRGAGARRRSGGPRLPHLRRPASTPRSWRWKQAGERARGATLYINLEPCSHQGRTPPCVDALIAGGRRARGRAMADPNPLVAGEGFAQLREAGHRGGDGRGVHRRSGEAERAVRPLHAHRPSAGDAQDGDHAGRQDRRAGRQSRLDHQRDARAPTCRSCGTMPTRS